ncbi:unnamed protein product [Rhizoctonia solani]|uniref:NACHT domain-containing protein n=1 Tax=Rhizoctonia solani TaxID=456999 RepID=A0A8H3B0K6_9AGAM|nr:unnamed protein product [Rhizoctonia solani]
MSSGSTSPKRSIRSSLKSFFHKKTNNSAHQQTGRSSGEPGIDESISAGPHRPPNLENQSESGTPSSSDPSPTIERHRNAASLAFEGTLRALHQSAEIFPPLQAAIGPLISGLEAVPIAEDHRRSYNSLLAELEALHEGIDKHHDKIGLAGMSDGTASILGSIEAEAKLLKSKRDQGRMGRILTASKDEDDLVQCYRRIGVLCRQLQMNIGLGTWSVAYEQLMNTRLSALSPALLAGYNSTLAAEINRRTCTENTRVAVLNALDSWSKDSSTTSVYWMSGMAGTGKTTIAATLSDTLFKRKQLGASFFCTRTSPECSSIDRVVPTLAYQLARYSRPFQAVLGRVLENDPDIGTRAISLQFERLIREPLLEIRNTVPNNTIIIIDALDECKDHGGVKTLLDALFQHAPSLPVKFFFTSRPEPDIREEVLKQQEGKRDVFYLHDIEQSIVQADIELYLREELAFMSPAEYQIKHLAQLAGNLFIYAATVIRYIRPGKKLADPQSRLELVLSTRSNSKKQYAELDTLYTTILNAALDEDVLEPTEMEYARNVLWTSVCAREPISMETLADIVEMDQGGVLAVLQSFLSVLHLYEKEGRVSILHASFPDFMFNPERSGIHFCDQKVYGQRLTVRCFAIMKAQLRFNIFGLESSFLPDASVPGVEERVSTLISPSLFYACRYWGDHIIPTAPSPPLVAAIEEFLSSRLLFWMEVLNMTKTMITGIMELQSARLWLLGDTNNTATKALALVGDAQSFVTSFSASSISLSTPHIHISALPFCPSSSLISHNYRMHTRGLINPKGALFSNRSSALLAVREMPNPISCISASSDGTLIAIGDQTGMISVLNQRDGTPIKSFVGHEEQVECIVFSPDSIQFASSSLDSTLRCWSRNGSLVLGPLVGHKDGISSVAFSPDGKRVATGGRDCTVRLWNVKTGSCIASPPMNLTYDDRIVTAIILSPDGVHVVSGLDSGAICIWDTQNHTVSPVSPNPHTASISFLGFALGGKIAISSSFGTPICLWDIENWSRVPRTFNGAEYTSGMAVSPDGSYVACGSGSGDMQLWNIIDGEIVTDRLEGPTGPILSQSLAFSADGTRLFSAAHDATFCMWNIQKDVPVNTPSSCGGHAAAVNSVMFSSDGTQLFSCADDAGVRTWNVDDGSLALSLEFGGGGPSEVSAMTFSQNGTLVAASLNYPVINLWSINTKTRVNSFSGGHTNVIYSLSFSHDGELLASGSADHTVCIWDLQKGTVFVEPLRGHDDIVYSVQFAPSGYHLASGSGDHTVCLWDTTSGQLISQLFSESDSGITSISYSGDGKHIVAGDEAGRFHAWKMTDSSEATLIISGPCVQDGDAISSIAFAPDSNLIATGSDDGTVNVWDRRNGKLVAGPFKGHSEEVTAVAWSPDGNVIASCSADHTIRLINLRSLNSLPAWIEGDWDIRDDGWVENQNNKLFWVSPDLHRVLPRPYNSLVIGPQGPAMIDYGGLLLGEDWAQCYT